MLFRSNENIVIDAAQKDAVPFVLKYLINSCTDYPNVLFILTHTNYILQVNNINKIVAEWLFVKITSLMVFLIDCYSSLNDASNQRPVQTWLKFSQQH